MMRLSSDLMPQTQSVKDLALFHFLHMCTELWSIEAADSVMCTTPETQQQEDLSDSAFYSPRKKTLTKI